MTSREREMSIFNFKTKEKSLMDKKMMDVNTSLKKDSFECGLKAGQELCTRSVSIFSVGEKT